jgi:hypothetical protein
LLSIALVVSGTLSIFQNKNPSDEPAVAWVEITAIIIAALIVVSGVARYL